jgi:hypothetical protein
LIAKIANGNAADIFVVHDEQMIFDPKLLTLKVMSQAQGGW